VSHREKLLSRMSGVVNSFPSVLLRFRVCFTVGIFCSGVEMWTLVRLLSRMSIWALYKVTDVAIILSEAKSWIFSRISLGMNEYCGLSPPQYFLVLQQKRFWYALLGSAVFSPHTCTHVHTYTRTQEGQHDF